MGFTTKVKAPAASAPATVSTPPPTVSETVEDDVQSDYNQRASRRKGLLSTILSNRRSQTASGEHTTLG